MNADTRFSAQYYDLTLRVRLQRGNWTVTLLGPQGRMILPENTYESEAEAKQAAMEMACSDMGAHESRPKLETVEWQSY
jgi:hypothetical protein